MQYFGIHTSSTESEEKVYSAEDESLSQKPQVTQDLTDTLYRCDLNWFQFIESVPELKQHGFSSKQEILCLRQSILHSSTLADPGGHVSPCFCQLRLLPLHCKRRVAPLRRHPVRCATVRGPRTKARP